MRKYIRIVLLSLLIFIDILKGLIFNFNKKKILFIFNHFFDQDIEPLKKALKYNNFSIGLVVLDVSKLYRLTRFYLPESATELSGYIDESLFSCKKRLKHKLKLILKLVNLIRWNKIIFISPSYQFFWIREFINTCKDIKIPFIVIDKEGTITPFYYERHSEEIKKYLFCPCDFIIVWSPRQKLFHVKAGFIEKNISIVGQLRSDYWFNEEWWSDKNKLFLSLGIPPENKTILFFDYEENNYIHDSIYLKGFNWKILLAETHSILFDIAKKYKNINIIFKVHPQANNAEFLKMQVNTLELKNVYVLTGATLSRDLIIHSDLIVGQQTTALLDAMLTSKPIVYTYWGNMVSFKDNLISFQDNKGIDVATSKAKLRKIIEDYLISNFKFNLTEEIKREREKLTDIFFYKADGKTAIRMLNKIDEIGNNFYEKTNI